MCKINVTACKNYLLLIEWNRLDGKGMIRKFQKEDIETIVQHWLTVNVETYTYFRIWLRPIEVISLYRFTFTLRHRLNLTVWHFTKGGWI